MGGEMGTIEIICNDGLKVKYDGRVFSKEEFREYLRVNGNGSTNPSIGFYLPAEYYQDARRMAEEIEALVRPPEGRRRRV